MFSDQIYTPATEEGASNKTPTFIGGLKKQSQLEVIMYGAQRAKSKIVYTPHVGRFLSASFTFHQLLARWLAAGSTHIPQNTFLFYFSHAEKETDTHILERLYTHLQTPLYTLINPPPTPPKHTLTCVLTHLLRDRAGITSMV